MPRRNGGSIFASAPPRRSSTTPVRTCTARNRARSTARASASQATHTFARKSLPAVPSSSIGSGPCGAVVADRRAAHAARHGASSGSELAQSLDEVACTDTRLSRIARLAARSSAARRLAGEMHDRIATRRALVRRRFRKPVPAQRCKLPTAPAPPGRRGRARVPSPRRRDRNSAVRSPGPISPVAPVTVTRDRQLIAYVAPSPAGTDDQDGIPVCVSPCANPTSLPAAAAIPLARACSATAAATAGATSRLNTDGMM